MISGIKRKTTAIESAFRYFQTIDLIVNHFKRDADREKIFELVQPESTLKDLLIATAAIHLYHNVGIRVGENLEFNQFSQDSAKKFELSEKSILTNELSELLMDSISSEINLLKRLTSLENKILNYLIEERRLNIKEPHRKEKISDIENQIEQNLLEVILNFPPFYFYDLLGDLIGYANDIKMKILEESSAFKDLSIEIEKKIKIEEKEDKVIEISTLNKLINKIQKDFEFKSYKELQMQNMSIRMIKRKVIDYNFNRYPISIQGLNMFREANNLKIDLIEKIDSALSKSINYEDFEKNMLSYIKSEIIKKMKSSPNDFIYFLESINECSFNEIMYILNKYGIHNILNLIRMDEDLALKVKRNMIRYNIDKYNIINLNSNTKNLILLAKKALCDLEILPLKKKIINYENLSESNLLEFINLNDEDVEHFWKKFQQNSGIKLNELKDFIRKKEIIDKVFIQDLKLNNYSQILLLLNFEDIISNLAKDIFYYLFSKILRQISRIIESYLKITNDKTLILLALRKIDGTTDSEDWVRIKLEELIIIV